MTLARKPANVLDAKDGILHMSRKDRQVLSVERNEAKKVVVRTGRPRGGHVLIW